MFFDCCGINLAREVPQMGSVVSEPMQRVWLVGKLHQPFLISPQRFQRWWCRRDACKSGTCVHEKAVALLADIYQYVTPERVEYCFQMETRACRNPPFWRELSVRLQHHVFVFALPKHDLHELLPPQHHIMVTGNAGPVAGHPYLHLHPVWQEISRRFDATQKSHSRAA